MSGAEVVVRPMGPGDLVEVEEIQRKNPSAAQWVVEDYMNQTGWIGDVAGRVVGFLVVRQVAAGETEILNIAVDPEWQRKGVAKRLLEKGLEAGEAYLEVRESNRAAREFYAKAGFQEVGRRRGYYRNPDEDGLILQRREGHRADKVL